MLGIGEEGEGGSKRGRVGREDRMGAKASGKGGEGAKEVG